MKDGEGRTNDGQAKQMLNISDISGTILGDGKYQDNFGEPKTSRVYPTIDYQYNYLGASLEKNDAENTPELTRPVLP